MSDKTISDISLPMIYIKKNLSPYIPSNYQRLLSINVRAGCKFIPVWLLFEKFLKEQK